MKTIYFVRHAESEGNVGLHFQGMHTALTERGKEQAAFVADRCSRLKIDAIVTSPMARALETTKVIAAKMGKPYEESELFAERRRPSSIVGNAMDNAEAIKINDEWIESLFLPGVRVLDGENYDDITARSKEALAFLAAHPSDDILVVSHGFFMTALLARIIEGDDLTPKQLRNVFAIFHTHNAGVSVVRHGGEWAEWDVYAWNDQAHLG